jgi:glycerol-3-phosphate dehydrogenase (NAD(P)+)
MLCGREHEVRLWARDPATADAINLNRRNPGYLSDLELPEGVRATSDLAEALEDRELVICSVPSHGVREVMARCATLLPRDAIVVSTVKGLELDTGKRMDEVLREELPLVHHPKLVFLSGPSFAAEIAEGKPTAVTLACGVESFAIAVQQSISSPWFRCYTSDDVIGAELGGALKNVIAIAVGICDGLGLGENARAALMTRGLREITRLGTYLGADPLTFLGLAGVGDLLLTCTGDRSRNRRVGLALASGRSLDEIVGGMSEVAEGVRTAQAARALAELHGIDMPISVGVSRILAGELTPQAGAEFLMTRQLKSENE